MTDKGFLEEIEKDAIVLPSEDKMSRLTELARKQLHLEAALEEAEKVVESTKAALKGVSEHNIPELMMEMGVKKIETTDGHKLKITPFFTGKITNLEAYDWLEREGYGEIIKISIQIDTRMSDIEKVVQVRQLLHDHGIEWNEEQGVHYQTLCKWIKDTITEGKNIDRDLFNVYTGWKTSIK
jgi:hypothetical protein